MKHLTRILFAILLIHVSCNNGVKEKLIQYDGSKLVLKPSSFEEVDKALDLFESTIDRPIDLYLPAGIHRNVELVKVLKNDSNFPKKILSNLKKSTTISGQIFLRIKGANISVENINFIRSVPYGKATGFIAFDRSKKCAVINCSFKEQDDLRSKNPTAITYYIVLGEGSRNRIDRCKFLNKKCRGSVIVDSYISKDSRNENQHSIINNYFGPRPYTGDPADTAMRLGGSGKVSEETSHLPAKFKILNNTFDKYSAYYEILSVKCSDNLISKNSFIECNGYISLRNAGNCEISDNRFIGNNALGTRGVRIQGPGHKVVNNYFENLSGVAIWIWGGNGKMQNNSTDQNPMPTYVDTENLLIESNSVVNCFIALQFFFNSSIKNTNIPNKVSLKKNLFVAEDITEQFISIRAEGYKPDLAKISRNFLLKSNVEAGMAKKTSDLAIKTTKIETSNSRSDLKVRSKNGNVFTLLDNEYIGSNQ